MKPQGQGRSIDLDDCGLAIARAIQNSSIWQSGSNTDISAYAKAQTTYAYGLDKSLLSLEGGSAKNVNIEAKTEVLDGIPPGAEGFSINWQSGG